MPLATELVAGEAQATTNTILLVEDDPHIGSFLEQAIEQETPYRAIVTGDGHAALRLVRHFTPRLFILDYGLPDMNGIELYDRLHNKQDMPLWKRTYRCENCRLVMDRDENSAVNLYQRFVAGPPPHR